MFARLCVIAAVAVPVLVLVVAMGHLAIDLYGEIFGPSGETSRILHEGG